MNERLQSFATIAAAFQVAPIKLLLWLKHHKANKGGLCPISLRITVAGKRIELSTGIRTAPPTVDEHGRETDPGGWDAGQQCLRGKAKSVLLKNEQLELLKSHVRELVNLMKATGRKVTVQSLRKQLHSPCVGVAVDFVNLCQQQIDTHYQNGVHATLMQKRYFLGILADWNGRNAGGQPLPLLLDEFSPERAAQFYGWMLNERKVKTETANNCVATLKSLFGMAADAGLADSSLNPFRILRRNKKEESGQRLHLSLTQFEALRDADLSGPAALARDVYVVQYYLHGSRVGAVLKLTWADVAAGRVSFKAEKGGPRKNVGLSRELERVLNRHQGAGGGLIFPYLPADFHQLDKASQYKARAGAISRINKGLRAAAAAVGIKGNLHSHTARHTLALHAAEMGGIRVAQEMLGHADQRMTERYIGRMDADVLSAAERRLYGGERPGPVSPEPAPPTGGKVRQLWAA